MTSKYRFDQNGTPVDPDAYFLLRSNYPGIGLPPPSDGGGGGSLANGGYAWGMNDDNQLGMGTNGAAPFFATPQLIAGGFVPRILGTNKSFTATSAPANSFSAMIDTGSSLYTWGSNVNGVAAGGSGATPSLRSASPGIGAWKKLAVGSNFTVGVTHSGQIWGWGESNPVTEVFSPGNPSSNIGITREYSNGTLWSDVTITGSGTILAIRNDGTLWAAGYNGNGTLGTGNFISTTTWVQTGGGTSDWYAISGGADHVLAIKTDGTLWAWGTGTDGQLGLGSNSSVNSPQQVGVVTSWAFVSTGAASSFAIRHDGTLWSWGRNNDGQLGLGDTTNRNVPTQVGTSTAWSRVAGGYNHAMGLRTDGTIWAWGNNSQGQLGLDVVSPPITAPIVVDGSTTWSGISAGYQVSMAVNGPSATEVVSRQAFYDIPGTYSFVVPQGVTSVSALAVGGGGGGGLYSSSSLTGPPNTSGGGGGALSYRNNVPVNPGDVLTVVVGAGGQGGFYPNFAYSQFSGGDGGDSYVRHVASNTYIAWAGGGGHSSPTGASGGNAYVGGGGPLGYSADGGGNGGGSWEDHCGGGGAGGYNGAGGTSTNALDNTNPFPGDNGKPAAAGSGGGGAGKRGSTSAGGGGGVGMYVIGTDGAGQGTAGQGGFGGSGGQNGSAGSGNNGGNGGLYGGGGGSGGDLDAGGSLVGGNGARGCVYIIWGPSRSFPSTSQLVT
jgi:alpha-tubulin suppressor-like RCC1 family protein